MFLVWCWSCPFLLSYALSDLSHTYGTSMGTGTIWVGNLVGASKRAKIRCQNGLVLGQDYEGHWMSFRDICILFHDCYRANKCSWEGGDDYNLTVKLFSYYINNGTVRDGGS